MRMKSTPAAITVQELRDIAMVVERLTKLERRTFLRPAIDEIREALLRGNWFLANDQQTRGPKFA